MILFLLIWVIYQFSGCDKIGENNKDTCWLLLCQELWEIGPFPQKRSYIYQKCKISGAHHIAAEHQTDQTLIAFVRLFTSHPAIAFAYLSLVNKEICLIYLLDDSFYCNVLWSFLILWTSDGAIQRLLAHLLFALLFLVFFSVSFHCLVTGPFWSDWLLMVRYKTAPDAPPPSFPSFGLLRHSLSCF